VTAESQGATEEDTQMANSGLTTRIPIWVRVPAIIALVLVGVIIGTTLLGAWADGGGHGSRDGRHGAGDGRQMRDHTGGGGGHGPGHETEMQDQGR
jgi:hypothetical protein